MLLTSDTCYNQEKVRRRNGNTYHQFLWVIKGNCILEIEDTTYTLSAGEGFFCKTAVPHNYYSADTTSDLYTAWFTFNGMEDIFRYFNIDDWFRFCVPDFLNAELKEMESQCFHNSTVISRSANLYSLLIRLLSYFNEENEPFNLLVDRYLENNYANDVSLDEIAIYMNTNKYSLCHKYSAQTGITIMENLKRIRIAKAKKYLVTTEFPISKITTLCGFACTSYFGKIFKESTGMTPRDYRKNIKI